MPIEALISLPKVDVGKFTEGLTNFAPKDGILH